MAFSLQDIIGGGVLDGVAKIISLFKVDPNVALQHQVELQKIQADMQEKILDAAQSEVAAQAEILKAEATSQSWLPRNVRPLLLLLWGSAITLNVVIAIVAKFWVPTWTPVILPDWVYKLTAIGYSGYVVNRTVEKCLDKDN